jgi:hypothetical protein
VLGRLAQLEADNTDPCSGQFLETILGSIEHHSGDSSQYNVVYHLCLCITPLLGTRQAELELGSCDAISAFAAALTVVAPADGYQGALPVCTIIEHIARDCHVRQVEFGHLGVISTLLDLFVAPGMPVACRDHVIATMLALLDAPENQEIFVEQSGMQALVDALRAETTLGLNGSMLLHMAAILIENPAYAQCFMSVDGVQALVDIMCEHASLDSNMAMWACNIAAQEDNHPALIAAGGVTALETAAVLHAGDGRIVPSVETALQYLH